MATTRTRPTQVSVDSFLTAVENPVRRADGETLRTLFERASGEPATMWGPSIIGFGSYHYRYDSGHEGEAPRIGFSPRKANLVLYLKSFEGFETLLAALGKHKRNIGCLYLNKLADVDLALLEEMIHRSWKASASAAS